MINLRNLIELLPYKYKQRDTYKVNGKGILERFLEVCGNYLADVVTPDIENELDLIDLNNVPEMYLNYLWEFLGEIPFAYGISIDKAKFDQYYNGLKTKEELIELSKVWTISKSGPVVLNETKVRNILKFAITLIKIRGTKLFFETLFKLYGFECTVTDPIAEEGNTDGITTSALWYDRIPKYDIDNKNYDSGSIYDIDRGCNQCVQVTFDISSVIGFADIDGEYFRDSLGIILSGNYDGLLDLYSGVTDWNDQVINMASTQEEYLSLNEELIFSGNLPASLKDFVAFRKMIKSFFDRYLPYNVIPHITYQGIEVDDQVTLTVEQIDDPDDIEVAGEDTIVNDILPVLHYRVTVSSLWEYTDTRWHIGSNGNWHKSGDILEVTVPGTYNISTYGQEDAVSKVITKVVLNEWYDYKYTITRSRTETSPVPISDHIPVFTPTTNYINVRVESNLNKDTLVNGFIVTMVTPIEPRLLVGEYSEIITPITGSGKIFKFTSEQGLRGAQKLVWDVGNGRQLALSLTAQPEIAYGSISPSSAESGVGLYFNLYTNWGLEDLDLIKFVCTEVPGWEYHNGDENPGITLNDDRYYHFKIIKNMDVDPQYFDRVKDLILANSSDYPTEWTLNIRSTKPTVKTIQLLDGTSFVTSSPLPQVRVRLDITGEDASTASKTLYVYKDDDEEPIKTIDDASRTSYIFEVFGPSYFYPGMYRVVTDEEEGVEPVVATFNVYDEVPPSPSEYSLWISPSMPWSTLEWQTDWDDIPDKLANYAVAKGLPIAIYIKLYFNGLPVEDSYPIKIYNRNGEKLELIKTIYTRNNSLVAINSTMLVHGSDIVFVHSASGKEATLNIM